MSEESKPGELPKPLSHRERQLADLARNVSLYPDEDPSHNDAVRAFHRAIAEDMELAVSKDERGDGFYAALKAGRSTEFVTRMITAEKDAYAIGGKLNEPATSHAARQDERREPGDSKRIF